VAGALLLLAAVVLGVLAFPPRGLWPVALVALAPVAALAESRGPRAAFLLTYAYAAVMALVIVRWLIHALAVEYQVSLAAAWAFTALLVAAYAWIPATAAALHAALAPRVGSLAAPLVFAALWILGEWLRAGPLGLPWILAAQPLASVPLALQTADLGGMHLPGFGVAAVGAGLGIAAVRRDRRALVAPGLLVVAALAYGGWRLAGGEGQGPPLRVGVVQAAVPQAERFRPGSALRNTARHLALSRRLLAETSVDLLVWSETSVDRELDRAPVIAASLRELVDGHRVPLVTGAPLANEGRPTNSVVVLRPGEAGFARYDKQRLVPFSESEPAGLAWLAPLVPELTAGTPYVPGAGPRLLEAAGVRLATPICFEVTYPDLLRELRARGGGLVLNLSNNAWFGRSGYADLHLAHAIFRAVELRSWVVLATNTGITAVIDPRGRVVERLPAFAEATLAADVRSTDTRSPFLRAGELPLVAVLLALPPAAVAVRRRAG